MMTLSDLDRARLSVRHLDPDEAYARFSNDNTVLQAQLDAGQAEIERQLGSATDGDINDALAASTLQTVADRVISAVTPPNSVRTIHSAWFRLALIEINQLNAVNAAVSAQGAAQEALWEYATTIAENDPDVNAIAVALGINLTTLFDRAIAIRDARNP